MGPLRGNCHASRMVGDGSILGVGVNDFDLNTNFNVWIQIHLIMCPVGMILALFS